MESILLLVKLAEREAELLPVEYFHVVFTLPQQIARLALQNARGIYSILFRAVAETLLTIAADPKNLGVAIGFLATFRRKIQFFGRTGSQGGMPNTTKSPAG